MSIIQNPKVLLYESFLRFLISLKITCLTISSFTIFFFWPPGQCFAKHTHVFSAEK